VFSQLLVFQWLGSYPTFSLTDYIPTGSAALISPLDKSSCELYFVCFLSVLLEGRKIVAKSNNFGSDIILLLSQSISFSFCSLFLSPEQNGVEGEGRVSCRPSSSKQRL
jgi:hypothetical protein